MELGEGEAQICRLCGQYESIYIDVFGEEGTKRFLGLKIHTKINITIDERDPLPKAICVQCLGKLEFVCDFQEECLRTQQVLRDRYNLPPLTEIIKKNDGLPQIVCIRCLGALEFLCDFYERSHLTQKELLEASKNREGGKSQEDDDAAEDKENVAPSLNEAKRKSKILSPESSKSIQKFFIENNMSYYRDERKEQNSNDLDNSDYAKNTQSVVQTVQLSSVILHDKILKDNQNATSNLKCRTSLMDRKEKKTVLCTTRSLNDTNSSEKNETNVSSELSVRRKRGRKSKLEKMREASLLENLKKEVQHELCGGKSDRDSFNENDKMYCLRDICRNRKSNKITNNTMISLKRQVEQVITEKQIPMVNTSLNLAHAKGSETDITYKDNIVTNESVEIESNDGDPEDFDSGSRNTKDVSAKSKPISVIIKQEKGEAESTSYGSTSKLDQLVWTASQMMMQNNDDLISRHNEMDQEKVVEVKMISPSAELTEISESNETDLAEQQNVIEISGIKSPLNFSDLEVKIFTEQNHETVIKSSQSNNVSSSKIPLEDSTGLCIAVDAIDQSTKSELECSFSGDSSSQRYSQNSFERNKSKDRSFGRISELISDEQKQAIETYYTVNMSVVNVEEVQKHITVVDKRDVRCNICGSLYLRMDKCQVHIWGHLQMKPYQCKACDFATVTVSNVRCHIRKSHLKIKPFACHLCEKRYVTAMLLEEHINTHTGARPYKCKLCDFASSSRQILSYHNATHKPVKDIRCKLCGKEFYSRSRLRAHMIVHNKDKVVICKLCSSYLANAESLETHHRNVHMQDYVCNTCGKRVKSRKALHNHQNVHSAAKYKCTLCPNVYKSSQILKEHLLKHKGIRKYKCSVCEKSFGQQSHLAAHMAVHSKIRFHCPGCDKPFNRQDNMKIHTKRCKQFLANPDLKNLLTKRERTISFNNIAELTAELNHGNIPKSVARISPKNQSDNVLLKTVEDQQKTAINLCKLGLNISCIESADKTWDRNNMYNDKEIVTSTEINVIKITNVNGRLMPETENLPVLENILAPESY